MAEEKKDERYERAKTRVQRLRNYYSSLIVFAVVMILLVVFNLLREPDNLWSLWIGLIWGIVLIIQGFNIFTIRDSFLGNEWEKRKIDEMIKKENDKK